MSLSRIALVALVLLGGAVWVGSLVCLAVVARVTARVLDPHSRIALFADVGRVYAILGTGALLIAIAAGTAISGDPATWSSATKWALGLAAIVLVLTIVAMAQARSLTILRREAAGGLDGAASLRSAARRAELLRGAMGIGTLAVVVLLAVELSR